MRARRSLLTILLGVLVIVAIWRSWPTPDAHAQSGTEVQTRPSSQPTQPALDSAVAPASAVAVAASAERAATAGARQAEHVDIDPAKAFRASPAQRADDLKGLRDAADLGDFGADLSDRALKGDADAAQALADLLRQCSMAYEFAQSSADSWRYFRVYAQLDEAELQAAAQAMAAEQARCSAFAQTDPEWYEWQAQQWSTLAAELGNPAANAELPPEDLRTPEARRAFVSGQRAALAGVLDESGPEALARHANALANVSGLRYEAFAIAACTLNPACAANPQDYPLRLWHSGQTGSNAVLTYMGLRMLTPRDRQIAEAQAQHVLSLWRARRFAELLAAQTPMAPDWP